MRSITINTAVPKKYRLRHLGARRKLARRHCPNHRQAHRLYKAGFDSQRTANRGFVGSCSVRKKAQLVLAKFHQIEKRDIWVLKSSQSIK